MPVHQRISNSQDEYNNTVYEDVKKWKVEVDCLKNTIKSLMKKREEEEMLKESVKEIKTEIKLLSASNKYMK